MVKQTKRGPAGAKPTESSRARLADAGTPRRGVSTAKTLRVQYVRSAIGFTRRQKETVRGLGLTKLNQIVELPDTPQARGMVNKVPHLVTILES